MKIDRKRWKSSDDKKPAWNRAKVSIKAAGWALSLLGIHTPKYMNIHQKNLTSRAHQSKQFHALLQPVWVSTLVVPSLLLNRALMLAKLLRILTSRSLCHSSLWNCCILLMTLSNCLTTTGLARNWPAELTEEINANCLRRCLRPTPRAANRP